MRRGIACLALLSATLEPNATYADTPPPATVWVAERVSASAPRVEIQAYFTWDHRGARIATVTANVERGRILPIEALTADIVPDELPTAYADGARYGCFAGSGCDLMHGFGLGWYGTVVPPDAPQPDRVYVAISARDIEIGLVNSPGWRLKRTRLRVRYVLSDGATRATGAQVLGEGVERFGEATLSAGPRGSLAIGTAPCRHLHRFGGVREGIGTATLTGGTRASHFDCRTDPYDPVAAADGRTTWRFAGDVVGVTNGTTRMTVIDL